MTHDRHSGIVMKRALDMIGEPVAIAKRMVSDMNGDLIGGGRRVVQMRFDPSTRSAVVDVLVTGQPLLPLRIEIGASSD